MINHASCPNLQYNTRDRYNTRNSIERGHIFYRIILESILKLSSYDKFIRLLTTVFLLTIFWYFDVDRCEATEVSAGLDAVVFDKLDILYRTDSWCMHYQADDLRVMVAARRFFRFWKSDAHLIECLGVHLWRLRWTLRRNCTERKAQFLHSIPKMFFDFDLLERFRFLDFVEAEKVYNLDHVMQWISTEHVPKKCYFSFNIFGKMLQIFDRLWFQCFYVTVKNVEFD